MPKPRGDKITDSKKEISYSLIPSAWPEFTPCNSDMLAIHGVQIASEAPPDSEDN
jgi:hypothetical protein